MPIYLEVILLGGYLLITLSNFLLSIPVFGILFYNNQNEIYYSIRNNSAAVSIGLADWVENNVP